MTLLEFFGYPRSDLAPHSDSARAIVCPPRYAPYWAVLAWNLAQQLTSWVTPVVIKQTSEKRSLLLIRVWLFALIKYGTGLIIALDVDEKSLDVESHSLVSVNRQKGTSPSHFLRNPTFGVISTTERLLSMPQITFFVTNYGVDVHQLIWFQSVKYNFHFWNQFRILVYSNLQTSPPGNWNPPQIW